MFPNIDKKLIEFKNRLRRNGIRKEAIVETPNKTQEECEIKVQEMFKIFNKTKTLTNASYSR